MTEDQAPYGPSAELLPCPFCGENEQQQYRDDSENHAVRCMYCGALGPWHGKDYQSAVKEWNTRKTTE